jgi:hypothetical protein
VSEDSPANGNPLIEAWSQALAPVLALLGDGQRGRFRQELQRYLATTRFQPNDAQGHTEVLKKLLIEAARAAAQPAAISLTREISETGQLVSLCEQLLADWRDAEAASGTLGRCAPSDAISGEVFFGPRLGGPGRAGALRREAPEDSDDQGT